MGFPPLLPLQAGPWEAPSSQIWQEGGGQKLQPYLHTDGVCPFPQPDAEGVPSRK